MSYKFPVLTPVYGLGSYGRTGASTIIGTPRSKLGSQKRIYSHMKTNGKGYEYEEYLFKVIYGIPRPANDVVPLIPFDPSFNPA
jgi:hypothetical protein